jgi:hypothetical protein
MEETIESLQKENAELKLAITEMKTATTQAVEMLRDIKEYNFKIAYSARLFTEAYFTKSEKLLIAAEFDRCPSVEMVEKVYNRHKENLRQSDAEKENNENESAISDFLFSGEFIKELPKLLIKSRHYDPFESIQNSVETIREHFSIEEGMKGTDNPQTEQQLRARWTENWDSAVSSVNDIISVLNELRNK